MQFFLNISWTLPLHDPVIIFALILLIILIAPLLLRKIRVPGIVGLILAGVAIGPKGLHVVELDSAIKLFGTVGLLYIMFLAGLEIDFRDFQRNARKSLTFGFLTFAIPLSIGTVSTLYILGFNFTSSLLLASMYATHTLISYPIVSRLGVTRNEAVTITVGGTIVTDTAALLLLSIITASAKGELNAMFIAEMVLGLSIFALVVLWVVPHIGRWFFRTVEGEGTSQYIFTLAVVFVAATLAESAKVEPIIGAFLAGLALNRLIPHSSALMNRIVFVGNALFIPFFLIRVGMVVDLRILVADLNAWKVAATILVVAYITKWLAAYITQQLFKYSIAERNIIFGLGSSHAAATLAIILVGFELKLFDESVLNGTVLMILVTCIASTFITERAAKQIAVAEMQKMETPTEGGQRILVPLANPANFEQLIDLAIFIKNQKEKDIPIFPLSVVSDDERAKQNILLNHKRFEKITQHAAATDVALDVIQRVDLNVAGGIMRASKDLAISDIVMGWNGKSSAIDFFFGSIMTQVLQIAGQTVLISKILQPVATFKRLTVVVPQNAELEIGFNHWLALVGRLSAQIGAKVSFLVASNDQILFFQNAIKSQNSLSKAEIKETDYWENFELLSNNLQLNDLLIIVAAREQTLSFSRTMERLPRLLSQYFEDFNFVIMYPEQILQEPNEVFLR